MASQNCWEFKRCGRQAGGAKAGELGVCKAAAETRAHGLNDGVNGGRACWALAGTLCGGVVQGSFASKISNCMACDFYKQVAQQQGPALRGAKEILAKLA